MSVATAPVHGAAGFEALFLSAIRAETLPCHLLLVCALMLKLLVARIGFLCLGPSNPGTAVGIRGGGFRRLFFERPPVIIGKRWK